MVKYRAKPLFDVVFQYPHVIEEPDGTEFRKDYSSESEKMAAEKQGVGAAFSERKISAKRLKLRRCSRNEREKAA